jgi:ubiquinone/menaquinone biosynthesis C-methylase UbiE
MALVAAAKNWDEYVCHAEEVARSSGFQHLRDRILAAAEIAPGDRVVDLGAGTGLLTLPAAQRAGLVWAIDISPRMCDYLSAKAKSAGLDNVEAVTTSAVSLPLVDRSAEVVVSNYCFHHLSAREKRLALAEAHRVLVPGGRLVIGDMMFAVSLTDERSRAVFKDKARSMLRRGPAGIWRLIRNVARLLTGRWERPATPEWWREALLATGFRDVEVIALEHEGGIALARRE